MIELNEKYEPLYYSDSRYFIVTGGRGSAKSFSIGTFLCLLSFEEGHRILFTRLTLRSAQLSIIPEFLEKLDLLGIRSLFKITKDTITNTHSGTEILFRGIKTSSGDQTANLKSLQGVTTWVYDEAEEEQKEERFTDIDYSVRTKGKQNRVILIMNPTTKEHWVYKRFFQGLGVQEGSNTTKYVEVELDGQKVQIGHTFIHTTFLDNKENLDPIYVAELMRLKKTNPKKYAHKILGGWLDKAEGVVFDNWKFGKFNPNQLQTSFGLDFGYSVDPDALSEIAIDKARKKIYLKEHYYKRGTKIAELAHIILDRAGKGLIISEVDPRLTDELKDRKVNIKPHKKGKIETGITLMKDYELIVDPESTNFAKELNNYVYADKTSNLYIDDYNHLIDSARYNIEHHLRDPNKGKYNVY